MNFFALLDQQSYADRRAFIVHYPATRGKTRFAQRICQLRPGVFYIDLLDLYNASKDLPHIRNFNLKALQKLLLELPCPPSAHTVLVDHGDFLFNTWSADLKNSFNDWLKTSLRSPSKTDKTFVFFIQTDGVLSATQTVTFDQKTRTLAYALNEFDAI